MLYHYMIWSADLPLSPHGFPPTDWAGLASEASRRQHIGNPSWTWSYPSRSIRVIQNTAPMCLKLIHILSFVCCTQLLTSYCFMFFKAVVGKVSISYWFWLIICYLLDNCRKGNRHPGMSASGAGRGRRRIRRRDRWSPRVAWWIGWTCVPQYAFYRVRSAGLGNTYLHRHCFHFTFTYEVVSRQEEWRPVCMFVYWMYPSFPDIGCVGNNGQIKCVCYIPGKRNWNYLFFWDECKHVKDSSVMR